MPRATPDRPAPARPAEPTRAELEQLLGTSHAALAQLLAENAGLRPEWKYYGAKSGWALKLFHGKRNLCFVIPKAGYFLVGFVFGAKGEAAALASELPEGVKQELRAARKYAEGKGVRVEVRSAAELESVRTLLAVKRLG